MSLLSRLESQSPSADTSDHGKTGLLAKTDKAVREIDYLKDRAQQVLLEGWDTLPFLKNSKQLPVEELRQELENIVNGILEEEHKALPRGDVFKLVDDLMDEIVGYGPITDLLEDETVNEVMVNGPKRVYVERNGKLEEANVKFRDDMHVMRIIDRIISPLGRHIDETSPMVDGRLPDGSRFNAIIPPLSLVGPVMTIRKFSKDPYMVEDLIQFGTLSTKMASFIRACVEGRLNIMISGGTGSGKTTTLNVCSSFIPPDERVVTIEDAAELQLKQDHVIVLESRPPNVEGKGEIVIRDLVRNALRMRPDRIVVGEVRGGEALDMLQAMNTGHDGSLTTCHANTPRDACSRIETMVLMAGMDLPARAIREQISAAIDVLIQQERLRDGSRRITSITEVLSMEGDIITLQELFKFERHGINNEGKILGQFVATGISPRFMDRLAQAGVTLPLDIFEIAH